MRPLRLYVSDFMCYDHAYIDFTQFGCALIVAKKENNADESNGAGKTTLFRAIEYALFNYTEAKLEVVIRDDTDACSVTFDFMIGLQEYRITRTRTRKGTTDVTLYSRITSGDEKELHAITGAKYTPASDKKHWKDISGRRAADTEKEIAKLIKVNVKSFRAFIHFVQNDFSGLSTATPSARKAILRDTLNLAIYSKLEKIAKEQSNTISKEIAKLNVLLETLGDPDKELIVLNQQLVDSDKEIVSRQTKLAELEATHSQFIDSINTLTNEHSNLESKFASLLVREQTLNTEKAKIETLIKEFATKKTNIVKLAQSIVGEVKQLEATQLNLIKIDFTQIETLAEQIVANKEKIAQLTLTIKNDTARCDKLRKPIPIGGECENCRQVITEEHRKACQAQLDQELKTCQLNVQNCKTEIATLTAQNVANQQSINSMVAAKKQLETINIDIAAKKKEIVDKRSFHDEFAGSFKKYSSELIDKNKEIEQNTEELKASSIAEAKLVQNKIFAEKQKLSANVNQIAAVNKELTNFTSSKAITQHNITFKTEDKAKKAKYLKKKAEVEEKLKTYPSVIQAFSNTGIPNIIIQNVLDDLQIEANGLLSQLKPGLQLSFVIEKTVEKTGDQADTLDINYTVNGKKRYYEQLSGAMQMSVAFSLKLGLSSVLQKMLNVSIGFLLLDEVDHSFDKVSDDCFTDIVKFLSKELTILVITHDEKLKDKFSNYVLVSQDINMVSMARVVSSW